MSRDSPFIIIFWLAWCFLENGSSKSTSKIAIIQQRTRYQPLNTQPKDKCIILSHQEEELDENCNYWERNIGSAMMAHRLEMRFCLEIQRNYIKKERCNDNLAVLKGIVPRVLRPKHLKHPEGLKRDEKSQKSQSFPGPPSKMAPKMSIQGKIPIENVPNHFCLHSGSHTIVFFPSKCKLNHRNTSGTAKRNLFHHPHTHLHVVHAVRAPQTARHCGFLLVGALRRLFLLPRRIFVSCEPKQALLRQRHPSQVRLDASLRLHWVIPVLEAVASLATFLEFGWRIVRGSRCWFINAWAEQWTRVAALPLDFCQFDGPVTIAWGCERARSAVHIVKHRIISVTQIHNAMRIFSYQTLAKNRSNCNGIQNANDWENQWNERKSDCEVPAKSHESHTQWGGIFSRNCSPPVQFWMGEMPEIDRFAEWANDAWDENNSPTRPFRGSSRKGRLVGSKNCVKMGNIKPKKSVGGQSRFKSACLHSASQFLGFLATIWVARLKKGPESHATTATIGCAGCLSSFRP